MEPALTRSNRRYELKTWLVAAVLGFATVALWLPVGFPGGTIEEWLILERYLEGMSPLETGGHFLRPLVHVPFYLGYFVTPGSFVGLNLLQILFVWGKSVAFYALLRRLRVDRAFSFAAAVLFLLYPADDGQMTLRTVAIQGALMLFLYAVVCLLGFGERARPLQAVLMVLSLVTSILIYEASFPLAAAAPLLLLLLPQRSIRRSLVAASLWYAALTALAGRYLYYLVTVSDTYQASVLSSQHGGFGEALRYLGRAYERSLWRGWGAAFESLVEAPRLDVVLSLVLTAVVIAVLVRLGQAGAGDSVDRRESLGFYGLVAGVALAIVALGFAMYLPTSVRESSWRTLFVPSMGGALMTVLAIRILTGWSHFRPRAFAWGVGLLVISSFVHLVLQHRGYATVARNQEGVLAEVEEAMPRLHPSTRLLLLFDDTDQVLSHDAFPYSRYFRAALSSRLGIDDLNAQICHPFTNRRDELCELGREQVSVRHQDVGWISSRLDWDVEYEAVVALHRNLQGEVTLMHEIPPWYSLGEETVGYRPGTLVDMGSGFRSPSGAWRVEFHEGNLMGGGWSFLRISNTGISYRFMNAPTGAVHLPLPRRDYHLALKIANGVTPELLDSLAVRVGKHPIEIQPLGRGEFEGHVDAALVAPEGDTVFYFEQDEEILQKIQSEKGPHLGLGFDWLHLTPIEASEPEKTEMGSQSS